MNNTNPSLRQYFCDIIPDESVFSYVAQYISEKHLDTGDDRPVPFFLYDNKPNDNEARKCGLYRAYMLIKSKRDDCKLLELLNGPDLEQCGVILRVVEDPYAVVYDDGAPAHLYNYYVAYEYKYLESGGILVNTNNVEYCLGVGF